MKSYNFEDNGDHFSSGGLKTQLVILSVSLEFFRR